MSLLLAKMKKVSTIKESSSLETSTFFDNYDDSPCSVVALNIALSGTIKGGLRRGLTTINGESRMFKSLIALIQVAAYMKKHPDSVCLFYDSEFGAGKKYFESLGIDTSRVLHTPVEDIEFLIHDIMQQIDALEKTDKVVIFVDSIGGLGSRKEATDALAGNDVSDMSRAKRLKSMSRLLPVRLVKKDIPMIAINHVYVEQKMYGKTIISGGQGILLASEVALIITRSAEKEDKEVIGYNFNIKVEKSRWVKEGSKISLQVRFDGGVNIYSGLLELAYDGGFVTKPKQGWYHRVDKETGEILGNDYKEVDTNCEEFMRPLIDSPAFQQYIVDTFQLSHGNLLSEIPLEEIEELERDIAEDVSTPKPKKAKK